jgi:hypothetical protein
VTIVLRKYDHDTCVYLLTLLYVTELTHSGRELSNSVVSDNSCLAGLARSREMKTNLIRRRSPKLHGRMTIIATASS